MVVKNKSALHISWDEGVKSFIAGNVGMLYTTIARRENIQKGAAFDVAARKDVATAENGLKWKVF